MRGRGGEGRGEGTHLKGRREGENELVDEGNERRRAGAACKRGEREELFDEATRGKGEKRGQGSWFSKGRRGEKVRLFAEGKRKGWGEEGRGGSVQRGKGRGTFISPFYQT